MFKIYIVTNILLWTSGIAVGQQETSLPAETRGSQEISYVIPTTFAQTLFKHQDTDRLLQVRVSKKNGDSYFAPVIQANIAPSHTIRSLQNKDELYSVLKQAKAEARSEFSNLFPSKKPAPAKPIRIKRVKTLKAAEKIRSASKTASEGTPEKATSETAASWAGSSTDDSSAAIPPQETIKEATAEQKKFAELKRDAIKDTAKALGQLRRTGKRLAKISFPDNSRNVSLLDGRVQYQQTVSELTLQLFKNLTALRNAESNITHSIRIQETSSDNRRIQAIALNAEVLAAFFNATIELFEGLLYQNKTNPTILAESWKNEKSLLHEIWTKIPKTINEAYDSLSSNASDFAKYYMKLFPQRMLKKPSSTADKESRTK